MNTTKKALPGTRILGSAMAVVMALGVASPAFARDQDRKAEHEQHDEGRVKARKAREDAQRAEPQRRNESFAPSRPDARAMQVREREDAQARNAARQQQQREQIDRGQRGH